MPIDHYEVLGLTKTASEDEIKRSFRKLSLKHHPDKGGDPEQYKKMTLAYEILSDPQKRQAYDTFGDNPPSFGGNDIFSNMFGNFGNMFNMFKQAQHTIRQAQPIVHPYEVTLEDLCTRKVVKLRFERQRACTCSKGSACTTCKGAGFSVQHRSMGPFMQEIRSPCNICHGSGKNYSSCHLCTNGMQTTKKDIQIHLTPEMENGYKYIVHNEGNHPHDSEPGDIIVIINYRTHPTYKVQNKNLILTHTLSLKEALCGNKITLVHPCGETIEISQNIVINPDIITSVKQKGLTSEGNLEINYKIVFPTELTPHQITELKNLL